MPADLTMHTLELANGVKLTWPKDLRKVELYGSVLKLLSNTDRLNQESMQVGYRLNIDGITSYTSKGSGSSQASGEPPTGYLYGAI